MHFVGIGEQLHAFALHADVLFSQLVHWMRTLDIGTMPLSRLQDIGTMPASHLQDIGTMPR